MKKTNVRNYNFFILLCPRKSLCPANYWIKHFSLSSFLVCPHSLESTLVQIYVVNMLWSYHAALSVALYSVFKWLNLNLFKCLLLQVSVDFPFVWHWSVSEFHLSMYFIPILVHSFDGFFHFWVSFVRSVFRFLDILFSVSFVEFS